MIGHPVADATLPVTQQSLANRIQPVASTSETLP